MTLTAIPNPSHRATGIRGLRLCAGIPGQLPIDEPTSPFRRQVVSTLFAIVAAAGRA